MVQNSVDKIISQQNNFIHSIWKELKEVIMIVISSRIWVLVNGLGIAPSYKNAEYLNYKKNTYIFESHRNID